MKLLHIDSSILGEASASRQLSAAIVQALTRAMPRLEVLRRDLDADPIPHLDSRLLAAVRPDIAADSATRTTDEKGAVALEEFVGADIVVIGAPMYNFTIASQLKAWLDRIIIAGKTFRYTEAGAKGLAGGKKVIIASRRPLYAGNAAGSQRLPGDVPARDPRPHRHRGYRDRSRRGPRLRARTARSGDARRAGSDGFGRGRIFAREGRLKNGLQPRSRQG
jgi:FMN-dependent NADH-azoreductase